MTESSPLPKPVFTRLAHRVQRAYRSEFLGALSCSADLRWLRLPLVSFMLGIVGYAYGAIHGWAIGTVIFACEVVILRVLHSVARHRQTASRLTQTLFWLTVNVATWAYFLPAIYLASVGSVPLLITSLLWTFGALFHISYSCTRLPLFLWSQIIPGSISAALVLYVSNQGSVQSDHWVEWAIAVVTLVLYFGTATLGIVTLTRTQQALATLRNDADIRHARLALVHRHDGLTGLLTRQAFDDTLKDRLSHKPIDADWVVFNIDLDGFKPINDSYSHAAGDAVLVATAQRLHDAAPKDALVVRLGGDEFAIAFQVRPDTQDLFGLGASLLAAIEEPIDNDGRALQISASIGVAKTDVELATVNSLCRAADRAMYHAKSGSTGNICIYSEQDVPRRPTLHDRMILLRALETKEITPHYQPKVLLTSGEFCGFEALARWNHPTRGLLGPADFVPLINELGLQGDFLTSIASTVFADVSDILSAGLNPGQVSINVPEVTLATLTGRGELDRLLDDYPQTLPYLTFEITEDVFIPRSGDVIQASIAHFRDRGVRISLDDFGTGFASFQHLRELEFDELKIDRSFVANLGVDKAAEVLIDGFLTIAHGLGVTVVAEGVETEEQRRHLIALGARTAQGWLFAHAGTIDDIRTALRRMPAA